MLTRGVHLVEGGLAVDTSTLVGKELYLQRATLRNSCYAAEVSGLFPHFTVEMR